MINVMQFVIKTKNKIKIKIHGVSMMWDNENIKFFPIIENIKTWDRALTLEEINCYSYQENCRIYLDEYPEQKELREEWLFNIKRMNEIIEGVQKAFYEMFVRENPYRHFINRFNKRN